MSGDTGNLGYDAGRALLGVATLGQSERQPDPNAGHGDRPMRDRSISDEVRNAVAALASFGLYDREYHLAKDAREEEAAKRARLDRDHDDQR